MTAKAASQLGWQMLSEGEDQKVIHALLRDILFFSQAYFFGWLGELAALTGGGTCALARHPG